MEKKFSKEEIKEKVIEIAAFKLGISREEILPQSNFSANLGADSLDLVEMVMSVEKTFGISIPDSVSQHFKTVGDVVDYLDNMQNAQ